MIVASAVSRPPKPRFMQQQRLELLQIDVGGLDLDLADRRFALQANVPFTSSA